MPKTDEKLLELIRKAAQRPMTKEERIQQKISFVYGQMMDCCPNITREEVEKIVREEG